MRKRTLEQFFLQQSALIQRYLMKMGASKEDAEDIVQDSMCKALEYIEVIETDKVSAWVFKVSINRYFTLYQKSKRLQPVWDDHAVSQLRSDHTLEDEVLNKELGQQVHLALGALKESYRNLMIMKYVLALSYKEIGLLLGLDESTVKTYLHRARLRFKTLWEDYRHDI